MSACRAGCAAVPRGCAGRKSRRSATCRPTTTHASNGGVGPQPSEQMIASIAQSLHMSLDERDHLFRLAGHAPPARGSTIEHISPGILRIFDRLHDTPTEIVSELGETLRQNAARCRPHRRRIPIYRCRPQPRRPMVHRPPLPRHLPRRRPPLPLTNVGLGSARDRRDPRPPVTRSTTRRPTHGEQRGVPPPVACMRSGHTPPR